MKFSFEKEKNGTVCSCHVTYTFESESRNSLLKAGAKSEGEVTATGLEPRTT